MRSFLVFTSLLPLLSSANPLPLESRQSTLDPFSLTASRSGSPIHLSAINANGESFWIGKKTASYCPADYTEVPGGQVVYVLPTGALSFTLAHAEGQPEENNGTTTGFSFTPGTDDALGVFSFTGLGSTGFLACPAKNGTKPWQIFADIKGIENRDVPGGNVSACLGFDALAASGEELGTANTGGVAAWEYE
ncbi:MAG: hypothetical protein Q9161_007505 [Pseudevernia consocians]